MSEQRPNQSINTDWRDKAAPAGYVRRWESQVESDRYKRGWENLKEIDGHAGELKSQTTAKSAMTIGNLRAITRQSSGPAHKAAQRR
ncbi:hypothetical protein MQE22_12560 [Acidithiobacillus sp. YTS05]|nr:hypothetical protein MQE22_12560 [Acidithiobacillus sp. YTS05]